jgi:hypothetical protein
MFLILSSKKNNTYAGMGTKTGKSCINKTVGRRLGDKKMENTIFVDGQSPIQISQSCLFLEVGLV